METRKLVVLVKSKKALRAFWELNIGLLFVVRGNPSIPLISCAVGVISQGFRQLKLLRE